MPSTGHLTVVGADPAPHVSALIDEARALPEVDLPFGSRHRRSARSRLTDAPRGVS
ncbi:hypothetical protein ACWGE1_00920 [Streptomyces sp. NPDC054932]